MTPSAARALIAHVVAAADDAALSRVVERALAGALPGVTPDAARALLVRDAPRWSDAMADMLLADAHVWSVLDAHGVSAALAPYLEAWAVRRVVYHHGDRALGYDAFDRLARGGQLDPAGPGVEAMLRRLVRGVRAPGEAARVLALCLPLALAPEQLVRMLAELPETLAMVQIARHPNATPPVWAAMLEGGSTYDALAFLAATPSAMADLDLRFAVLRAGCDGQPELLATAAPHLDPATMRQWVMGFADEHPDLSQLTLEQFGSPVLAALTPDDWAVLCASKSAKLREAAMLRVGVPVPSTVSIGYQRPCPVSGVLSAPARRRR
jgi:hypothetical protein